ARYAGSRVSRVEDPRLLTGAGTYVDDVALPGMWHACFVRSPFARARVKSVDVAAARELTGVHAVFLAQDLNPRMHEQWHTAPGKGAPGPSRPPLADDAARFVGDPIALVVAESRYIAEDAAELVDLDLEPLPPIVDYALAADSDELVHPDHPGNMAL